MNILVVAPIARDYFKRVEEEFSDCTFTYSKANEVSDEMLKKCDVIVGNPNTEMNINRKNIKAILLNSAGSDDYIKEGLIHKNTILTNASGTYGKAIAEHTIGMILALNKHLDGYTLNKQKHLWKVISGGKELYNSVVLIVGLGDLGYEIAKRIKAFKTHVIAVKRRKSSIPQCVDELYTIEHLDQVLPKADYVICALPQNKYTIHMFNKERFLAMKKDSVFINVGRGSVVNTNDLIDVLKQNHLYGVGLDVLEEEPLSKDNELWNIDNVMITPHCSGGYEWNSTKEYYIDLVIRNIHHLMVGEGLENEVDFKTGYRKTVKLN